MRAVAGSKACGDGCVMQCKNVYAYDAMQISQRYRRGTQAVDASTAVPISIRNTRAASNRSPSSRTCAAASRHVELPDRHADKGEQEKSEPIAIDTGAADIKPDPPFLNRSW